MSEPWYNQIPWPGALADLILLVHFLVVAFVVLGQLAILMGWCRNWQWVRNFWFRSAHLATIAYVVIQTWLGQLCPLTVWEQQLRVAAGQQVYQQTFIEHWLGQLMFFDFPWGVFIAAYTLFGLLVLVSWWWYPPRWPKFLIGAR